MTGVRVTTYLERIRAIPNPSKELLALIDYHERRERDYLYVRPVTDWEYHDALPESEQRLLTAIRRELREG